MRSRSFSLYAFLFSAVASTAIFMLLGSPSRELVSRVDPTPVTVHARTVALVPEEDGVVLGDATENTQTLEEQNISTDTNHSPLTAGGKEIQEEETEVSLQPLTPNYFQHDATYVNSTGVFSVSMSKDTLSQEAFVRVIESYTNDILPHDGWRQVTKAREFQVIAPDRQFIHQLSVPVTVTAKYHREHLGTVDEHSLTLFYWSQEKARWVGFSTTVNPKTQTVSAKLITPNVRIAVFGT